MRRFPARAAVLLAVLLLAYAIIVPALDPAAVHAVDLAAIYQAPGAGHWFGTDQLGRDLWVRTAAALRLSLALALGAAVASTVLGVLAGAAAATGGKLADRLITRLIDTLGAIPHLLLGVVVLALWPGQGWAIVLSIALTHWVQVARIVRASLLAERESGYVKLSAGLGARRWAIWRTHLIPAVLPQAGIALVLTVPHAIWHESALSFLGVGLPAQSASLGLLLEDARGGILTGAWWLLAFPAAALVLASWAAGAALHQGARQLRPAPRRQRQAGWRGVPVSSAPVSLGSDAGGSAAALFPAAGGGLAARVSVRSGDTVLLDGAALCAAPGTVHVVMGPSGAGKTTLLKALAGLLPAGFEAQVDLVLHGRPLPAGAPRLLGRELVFIPGSAATALNPVRTVGTALARTFRQHGRGTRKADLAAHAKSLGLEPGLLSRYPHELSGGQAQRAVLALGLAGTPKCLLLDEPTSALDARTRQVIARVLRERAEAGAIVILVTHDMELAEQLGDVLHTLEHGQLSSCPIAQGTGGRK